MQTQQLACPGCGKVGKFTPKGWFCLACPYSEKTSSLYHRCSDGIVRFMHKGYTICHECANLSSCNCPAKIQPLDCPVCHVIGVHTSYGWFCSTCRCSANHTAFYHRCADGDTRFIVEFIDGDCSYCGTHTYTDEPDPFAP